MTVPNESMRVEKEKPMPSKISYVLNTPNPNPGHRLGVNALEIDTKANYITDSDDTCSGVLYSGGRDGLLCCWNLNHKAQSRSDTKISFVNEEKPSSPSTSFKHQFQAHTHWINDIALTHHGQNVISCSSDQTVKLWRPREMRSLPHTLGHHNDFVKCLASPSANADWIASGGLDQRIYLWDLNGSGSRLTIDVGSTGPGQKGSVHALAASTDIIASGSPENLIRLWDSNTGQSIATLSGHQDNVRSLLISEDGRRARLISGSTDKTVKVWSIPERRCVTSLEMHAASIWSLHSRDPFLQLFWSADRNGCIFRTALDMGGESCSLNYLSQEQSGILKMTEWDGDLWVATKSSAITKRSSRKPLNNVAESNPPVEIKDTLTPSSDQPLDSYIFEVLEGSAKVTSTLELNDRQHVLTSDTDGSVVVWDVVKGISTQIFTDSSLEYVAKKLETDIFREKWFRADIRLGILMIELSENTCFTGEAYADELDLDVQVKDDQRVHLARWTLKNMFGSLEDLAEMSPENVAAGLALHTDIRRAFRSGSVPQLGYLQSLQPSRTIFSPDMHSFRIPPFGQLNLGLNIGLATPAPAYDPISFNMPRNLHSMKEESEESDSPRSPRSTMVSTLPPSFTSPSAPPTARVSQESYRRSTNQWEYFPGSHHSPYERPSMIDRRGSLPTTTSARPASPYSNSFMQKFRLFGSRKLSRTVSAGNMRESPSSESGRKSVDAGSRAPDSPDVSTTPAPATFGEVLRRQTQLKFESIRQGQPLSTATHLDPPTCRMPPETTIILSQAPADSVGLLDVYRGTVGTVIQDIETLEYVAPVWLGEMLFLGKVSNQDIKKVSFNLKPYPGSVLKCLPIGNSRLNANRMLRVRKIILFIYERLPESESLETGGGKPQENRLEDLEILCKDKVVTPTITLGTLRQFHWKDSSDLLLTYRLRQEAVPVPDSTL
ncbi:UBP9-binding protein bun107 [Neolecta irregularis DAH-3]|uniref:UBP9-binding protein bun107 n=1 Tax=Neolecta irregularis (strain DAH-3) TaxID=1198029 RepID=A0A1U7LIF7_NEOID|nr:UBP9-binding protein bun107 [Neolecta irregularis DAH-3]|eukprot:OLL22332.1 UBP9-binding protein bun107 [Neolecta irregularis DAH-3]